MPERTVVVAVPSAPRASSNSTPPDRTRLFSSVSRRRTPASAPCSELLMTTPSPCGPAGLIAPITLLAIRPDVLKNAIPASAATSPDSIVTPEMSTKFSLSSLAPSDWRATVTTFPPPSRRYGAVPASVSTAARAGS